MRHVHFVGLQYQDVIYVVICTSYFLYEYQISNTKNEKRELKIESEVRRENENINRIDNRYFYSSVQGIYLQELQLLSVKKIERKYIERFL